MKSYLDDIDGVEECAPNRTGCKCRQPLDEWRRRRCSIVVVVVVVVIAVIEQERILSFDRLIESQP